MDSARFSPAEHTQEVVQAVEHEARLRQQKRQQEQKHHKRDKELEQLRQQKRRGWDPSPVADVGRVGTALSQLRSTAALPQRAESALQRLANANLGVAAPTGTTAAATATATAAKATTAAATTTTTISPIRMRRGSERAVPDTDVGAAARTPALPRDGAASKRPHTAAPRLGSGGAGGGSRARQSGLPCPSGRPGTAGRQRTSREQARPATAHAQNRRASHGGGSGNGSGSGGGRSGRGGGALNAFNKRPDPGGLRASRLASVDSILASASAFQQGNGAAMREARFRAAALEHGGEQGGGAVAGSAGVPRRRQRPATAHGSRGTAAAGAPPSPFPMQRPASATPAARSGCVQQGSWAGPSDSGGSSTATPAPAMVTQATEPEDLALIPSVVTAAADEAAMHVAAQDELTLGYSELMDAAVRYKSPAVRGDVRDQFVTRQLVKEEGRQQREQQEDQGGGALAQQGVAAGTPAHFAGEGRERSGEGDEEGLRTPHSPEAPLPELADGRVELPANPSSPDGRAAVHTLSFAGMRSKPRRWSPPRAHSPPPGAVEAERRWHEVRSRSPAQRFDRRTSRTTRDPRLAAVRARRDARQAERRERILQKAQAAHGGARKAVRLQRELRERWLAHVLLAVRTAALGGVLSRVRATDQGREHGAKVLQRWVRARADRILMGRAISVAHVVAVMRGVAQATRHRSASNSGHGGDRLMAATEFAAEHGSVQGGGVQVEGGVVLLASAAPSHTSFSGAGWRTAVAVRSWLRHMASNRARSFLLDFFGPTEARVERLLEEAAARARELAARPTVIAAAMAEAELEAEAADEAITAKAAAEATAADAARRGKKAVRSKVRGVMTAFSPAQARRKASGQEPVASSSEPPRRWRTASVSLAGGPQGPQIGNKGVAVTSKFFLGILTYRSKIVRLQRCVRSYFACREARRLALEIVWCRTEEAMLVDPALLVEAAVHDPFYVQEAERERQAEEADARLRAMQRNGVGGGRGSPTVIFAQTGGFGNAASAAQAKSAESKKVEPPKTRGAALWETTRKKMIQTGSQAARKSIRKRGSVMSSSAVIAGWLSKEGIARMADIKEEMENTLEPTMRAKAAAARAKAARIAALDNSESSDEESKEAEAEKQSARWKKRQTGKEKTAAELKAAAAENEEIVHAMAVRLPGIAPLLPAYNTARSPAPRPASDCCVQRQHRKTFIKVQKQGRKLDKIHSDIAAAKMAEEAKSAWTESQKHSKLKDLPAEQLAQLRQLAGGGSPTNGRKPEGATVTFGVDGAAGNDAAESEEEDELEDAVGKLTATSIGLPALSEFDEHPRRAIMAQRRIVRPSKRRKRVRALLREQQMTFGELGGAAYNAAKLKHEGRKGAPRMLTAEDVKSMVRAKNAEHAKNRLLATCGGFAETEPKWPMLVVYAALAARKLERRPRVRAQLRASAQQANEQDDTDLAVEEDEFDENGVPITKAIWGQTAAGAAATAALDAAAERWVPDERCVLLQRSFRAEVARHVRASLLRRRSAEREAALGPLGEVAEAGPNASVHAGIKRRTRRQSVTTGGNGGGEAGTIDTQHMQVRMKSRRQSVTDHHKLLNQEAAATLRGHRNSILSNSMTMAAQAARDEVSEV